MSSSIARRIAKGHAWTSHKAEFPEFANDAEFARHIDAIMTNPSALKKLARGRTAYWDDQSRTVVIHDPKHPDLGTAFRPSAGRAYFDNMR